MKPWLTGVARAPRTPLIAVITAAALLAAGCAPTLEEAKPIASPDLVLRHVRTVTVLPVDLAIDADDPGDHGRLSPDEADRAERKARPIVAVTLNDWILQRGYRTVLVTDQGGLSGGAGAIDPNLVGALDDWMLGYSDRVARGEAHPGEDALDGGLAELPTDATLFVGGYGHLKEDESHRAHVAKQVAIGVGIAVLIAATICLLVFAARGGGGGGGGGSALAGLGKVAASGARVAASAARVGAEVGFRSARLAAHAARIGLHALPRDLPSPGCGCGEDDPCATRSLADPAWATQQAPPLEAQAAPPGSANFLALGAVLVDNATGRILWASAQNMPIDPVDPRELRQATEHLLAALPPAH